MDPVPMTPPAVVAPSPVVIPHKHRSWVGVVFGVIITGLAIAAGALLYQNYLSLNDEYTTAPAYTPRPSTSPTGAFCGGIAAIPCPAQYTCVLDGNYPDAGGHCVSTSNPSVPADWKNFSSKYFTLSFKVPPELSVVDGQNTIAIGKFMALNRYPDDVTKAVSIQRLQRDMRDVKTSQVIVGGSTFTRMEGTSPYTGIRHAVVFFDQSALSMDAYFSGADPTVDYLALASQILSTFRFTR